ncbi:MAG: hypothetical protein ACLRIS_05915 [Flavonifractor plautii]
MHFFDRPAPGRFTAIARYLAGRPEGPRRVPTPGSGGPADAGAAERGRP